MVSLQDWTNTPEMNLNSSSISAPAVPRPPATLLAAAILISLSFLLAAAEWWSDYQGYDLVLATVVVPQERYPSWDSPVNENGWPLVNPAEHRQDELVQEASAKRDHIETVRERTSVVLIGVMFVTAYVCGSIAWYRMRGRKWSAGAAILCSLCLNSFTVVLFLTAMGFAIATEQATGRLVSLAIVAVGVLVAVYGYVRVYRILRNSPNDAGPETRLPRNWRIALSAVLVAAVAFFAGTFMWLEGKQRQQRAEAEQFEIQSAAIAKAFADEALKAGKAKYPNQQAWKNAHPFDHRFD